MSSRVTKTEPTFRCSRCVCVCVVGSCAQSKSVKVGCFFFGRRLCTKKPQKREKKREKKREFFSHKNERRRKNKRTRLCKESRLEEDSFFLSFVWKETFTRDNERKENAPKRAKNKEKRRERERREEREKIYWEEKKTKARWIRTNKTAFKSFCGRSKRRTRS